MKKNNLLLVFIIFTTVSLFFAGCSFEAIGERQNHDESVDNTHFKKENVNFKTFSKYPKLMGKLNKNKETLKSITSNKIISSSDQSFYIDTNDALYIEDGNGLHSYTFTINRNLENVFLENLVIQLQQDGTYKSFIVSYNITEQELEDLKNGTLADINNKISLQVIDDDNFTSGFENKVLYEPCIAGASQTWKCSYGIPNHGPGNPGPPECVAGSFEYVINVNWGICSVYTSEGDNVPVGTTTVNNGGGGTPSNSTGTIKTDAVLSPDLLLMKDFVRDYMEGDQKTWYFQQSQQTQDNIFDYLLIEDFSTESKNFVKEIIDIVKTESVVDSNAFSFVLKAKTQNKINNDLDDTFLLSVDNIMDLDVTNYIVNSPTDPLWIHFSIQCAVLRANHPNWSDLKIYWEASKEMVHITLDVLGLVPVFGEVADLTNGVLYLVEGDGVNASLSVASAVPLAGWAAVSTKYAFKITSTATGTTKLVWKVAGNILTFGNRSQLRKVLNLVSGNPLQAHHIIPWNKQSKSIVQRAAKSSNAFHMNEALNGIPLSTAVHNGSHANYDNVIQIKFDQFNADFPNATPDQCYVFLTNLIQQIKLWIANNPNTPINNISLP